MSSRILFPKFLRDLNDSDAIFLNQGRIIQTYSEENIPKDKKVYYSNFAILSSPEVGIARPVFNLPVLKQTDEESVVVDLQNSKAGYYPLTLTIEEVENDLSFRWFLMGTEQIGETSYNFTLPTDDSYRGKVIQSEVTDVLNNVTTSNYFRISSLFYFNNYDFEEGISSDWTSHNFVRYTQSDRHYSGNYSAGNRGTTLDCTLSPPEWSGGVYVDSFEIYWLEETNQSGFTFQFVDSNGNVILEIGGNNPQWEINDADGSPEVFGGNGYDRPIRYLIEFDWDNGKYSYTFEDINSGDIRTGNRTLFHNTNIEKFKINDSNGSWGSADYLYIDNISVKYYKTKASPIPPIFQTVSIKQNANKIEVDLENSLAEFYPINLTAEDMRLNGDISVKWFMDGIEQTENLGYFELPLDNSHQGKEIYLELTDSNSNVVSSNIVIIQELKSIIYLNNLLLWFDASDNTTVTLDSNNKVTDWSNKNGSETLTQTNSNNRATYKNNILNGKSVVSFEGNQFYDLNTWDGSDILIYCVIIPRNPSLSDKPQEQHIIQFGDNGAGVTRNMLSIREKNSDGQISASIYDDNVTIETSENNNVDSPLIITSLLQQDGKSYIGINNQPLISNTGGTISTSNGAIGRASDDSSYLSADLGEILISNDKNDINNRNNLVSFLNIK